MSDDEALLAAIHSYPEDDTVRLVYTDWLEEHGDPNRADFVRIQIERSRLSKTDPQWNALIKREVELLVDSKNGWLRPYLSLTDWNGLFICRGIVECLVTSLDRLTSELSVLRELTALFELHPRINEEHNGELIPADAPGLTTNPYCAVCLAPRVTGLRVRLTLKSSSVDLLMGAPNKLEPALTAGEWVILAWFADDPEQQHLVGRLIDDLHQVSRDSRSAAPRHQFGVRPFRSRDEFAKWCPLNLSDLGPHWIRLRDGKLVDHRPGFEPPRNWVSQS